MSADREPHTWDLLACRCSRCGATFADVASGRTPVACAATAPTAGTLLDRALTESAFDRLDRLHRGTKR